jgi:cholesterol 24(S)-hydroxylase
LPNDAFSTDFDFNALEDRNSVWVHTYNTIYTALMDPTYFFFPILESHFMWLLPKRRHAHKELEKFRGMIIGVIEEKRRKIESGQNQNINLEENEKDLITLMLESEMKGEGKMTNDELEVKK